MSLLWTLPLTAPGQTKTSPASRDTPQPLLGRTVLVCTHMYDTFHAPTAEGTAKLQRDVCLIGQAKKKKLIGQHTNLIDTSNVVAPVAIHSQDASQGTGDVDAHNADMAMY
jgi:hypothetical protein